MIGRHVSLLLARGLREPIVHFVLVGLGLFALHASVRSVPDERRIEVSEALRQSLREDYLRRTGDWPSATEEAVLVEQYVDDEVLFREALAYGLEQGDPVVRRRLIEKMRFLNEDLAVLEDPAPAELSAYFRERVDRYRQPDLLSFRHVFVSRTGDGAADRARALEMLDELVSGPDPASLGDPFLNGYSFRRRSVAVVDARFGEGFGEAVEGLPVGMWAGPVRSSYGLHLVLLDERVPARLPEFNEVADAVRRDWLNEQRERANREALERLREGYEIRIAGEAGGDIWRVADREQDE